MILILHVPNERKRYGKEMLPMGAVPASRYIFGSLPWYSFLIVSGAVIAVILASREERRAGFRKDTVIDLALWILPGGIIGARLYYVAFSWDQFRDDPVSILKVWEGGIAIYGAVIAGFLIILLFSRRRKIPALKLCDIIAPGLILAQAIGRWGNYFNSEAYGLEITNPSLQFFPFGVLIPEAEGTAWHMATFFYESAWNLCVFVFLMIARRRWFRKPGDVFLFYVFLYSCGRLVIEDYRMDSLYATSSVRISQLLSVVFCAVILILYMRRRITEGRGSRIGCVPAVAALLYTLPVIAFTLNLFIPPAGMTVGARTLFLLGYSLLSIVSLMVLYGRSGKDEVYYAIRTDEKPAV